MASERVFRPGEQQRGGSQIQGSPSDVRRAQLAREQHSRVTADAMESGGHADLDTSAWVDEYRSKLQNRGHHGPVRR